MRSWKRGDVGADAVESSAIALDDDEDDGSGFTVGEAMARRGSCACWIWGLGESSRVVVSLDGSMEVV